MDIWKCVFILMYNVPVILFRLQKSISRVEGRVGIAESEIEHGK